MEGTSKVLTNGMERYCYGVFGGTLAAA